MSEAASLIRLGKLSPVELTQSILSRIERVEPGIRAWARLCPAEATRQAKRLETLLKTGTYLGPLHGIPLGVKDIYYTAGLETSAGSCILNGFVPNEDATVVRCLREAGAILLGKTATTEFAAYDPAPTRNPHNTEHTPGGSSSGSAAAVAAGMCLGALGSQTVGSIIRPAAYCGIVGLKPTYGRISRHGMIPLAWSLDHPGLLTKRVRDAATMLDVIAAPDPLDASIVSSPPASFSSELDSPLLPLTVGIPDRYFLEQADSSVLSAYDDATKVLEKLGLQLRKVRLPGSFEAGVEAGRIIMHVEAAAFHQQWHPHRADDYSPKLRALIEAGMLVSGTSYLRAQQVRRAAIQDMCGLFSEIDLLATPATPTPAPEGLSSTGSPIYNAPFTTFGFPSLTVPAGFTPLGLPLGLQLAARHFEEATLLQVGVAFEEQTEGLRKLPPL